jgi:hypothetical protein
VSVCECECVCEWVRVCVWVRVSECVSERESESVCEWVRVWVRVHMCVCIHHLKLSIASSQKIYMIDNSWTNHFSVQLFCLKYSRVWAKALPKPDSYTSALMMERVYFYEMVYVRMVSQSRTTTTTNFTFTYGHIKTWRWADGSSPWWWRQQGPLKCW